MSEPATPAEADVLVDIPPEHVERWVHAELHGWLDETLSSDPSPDNAAKLYAGALAAVVGFSWQQFDGAKNPEGFVAALLHGVRGYVLQLLETPPTRQ